jgi:hypothetical protein
MLNIGSFFHLVVNVYTHSTGNELDFNNAASSSCVSFALFPMCRAV